MPPKANDGFDATASGAESLSTTYAIPGMKSTDFEVKDAGSKGIGCFALKYLPRDTRFYFEKPIITIQYGNPLTVPQQILDAYKRLDLAGKRAYDSLRAGATPAAHPERKTTERFVHNAHSDAIPGAGQKATVSVYHIASLMNHSCRANSINRELPTKHGLVRICYIETDVKKGEEITFAYNTGLEYLPTDERKAILASQDFGSTGLAFIVILKVRETVHIAVAGLPSANHSLRRSVSASSSG